LHQGSRFLRLSPRGHVGDPLGVGTEQGVGRAPAADLLDVDQGGLAGQQGRNHRVTELLGLAVADTRLADDPVTHAMETARAKGLAGMGEHEGPGVDGRATHGDGPRTDRLRKVEPGRQSGTSSRTGWRKLTVRSRPVLVGPSRWRL